MAIVFSTPTRNQREFVFSRLLPSLLTGNVVPDIIHIWDNSDEGDLPEWASTTGSILANEGLAGRLPNNTPKMIIEGRKENTTLSTVWNHAIEMSDVNDSIILSNDDIEFLPDTIEKLVKFEAPFAYPAGARAGNSFALYKISKAMWLDVGPFDSQFIPAYHEDNDYHWRMKLKGYDITPITDCEYLHIGSATNRAMSQHEQALLSQWFRRGETYYRYKWGGMPHHERYTIPFNGIPREVAVTAFNRRYKML